MGSKILSLRTLLNENDDYTIDELKSLLSIRRDSDLFKMLVDHLVDEIDFIPQQNYYEQCEEVLVAFDYLQLFLDEERKIDEQSALIKIHRISNIIKEKRKSLRGKREGLNNFYNMLSERCSTYYMMINFKKNDLEEDHNYLFLTTTIYQTKNYQLLKCLVNKIPDLVRTKTPYGNTLFEDVLEKYITTIKEAKSEDYFEILYYENVIDLFLNTNKANMYDNKILNRILLIIDVLKRDKHSKKENERKIFFLRHLKDKLSDSKRAEIKGIDELDYKYNINYSITSDEINRISKEAFNGVCVDFTDKRVITIDPKGSQCLDDALSVEELKNGNYLVGIYISDVSSVIQPGSIIDIEAAKRGRTIFLQSNKQLSMIPYDLANDECSLLPNGIKSSICCLVELEKSGNIVNYDFFRANIKVHSRLSYEEADKILTQGIVGTDLFESLKKLKFISYILKEKNKGRDKYRNLEGIEGCSSAHDKLGYNTMSHEIVSEFMILMNHLAPKYASQAKLPYLYRVHESNDLDSNIANVVGLREFLDGNAKICESIQNSQLAAHFSRARYSAVNIGHQGLGYDSYSHSTSPIRRYSDLVNQWIIRDFFIDKKIDDKNVYFWEDKTSSIAQTQNLKEDMIANYTSEYYKVLRKSKRKK